jgi:transposase-like protein
MVDNFDSLFELTQYFKDEQTCLSYLEQWRWKDGIHCPHCGMDKIYRFSDGKRFRCGSCREQFTAKIGTIFEGSKIPMVKWYIAIYMVLSHKKGLSSHQLARDIKITQKTAWFMLHRIRFALGQDDMQFTEDVAIDESFVGGKNKNRHKDKKIPQSQGRSFKDKTPVLGMVSGGIVKTVVIPSTGKEYVQPIVRRNVVPGTTIITDEWWAYRGLSDQYNHFIVDHARGQYMTDSGYTTNTIEGFWTWLKRSIIGIYHSVSRKHLQQYCNEVTFRYNTLAYGGGERVKQFFEKINCRLSYKMLTA